MMGPLKPHGDAHGMFPSEYDAPEYNETGHPDSRKTMNAFQEGGITGVGIGLILVVSLFVLYFLFRYLIWYSYTYIGPAWL